MILNMLSVSFVFIEKILKNIYRKLYSFHAHEMFVENPQVTIIGVIYFLWVHAQLCACMRIWEVELRRAQHWQEFAASIWEEEEKLRKTWNFLNVFLFVSFFLSLGKLQLNVACKYVYKCVQICVFARVRIWISAYTVKNKIQTT